MVRAISAGVVFAGLLCTSSPTAHNPLPQRDPDADPRLAKLQEFLDANDCPIKDLAADFLVAADRHDLDWRLLPSISFVESGGGKEFRNNNIFGWDNCRQSFPSIRDGIHIVASRLAVSPYYRDKDLHGKLQTYNPRQDYARRVKAVMQSISSDPPALN
jgi:hypothetical protein